MVDDEEATFTCIVDIICDKIKQKPWIVAVCWSLERKMYAKYVNKQQREGPGVNDAINKIALVKLSIQWTYLCVGRWQRRKVCLYCWKNMWWNNTTTLNICGLLVIRTKIYCKYVNNRQREGPAVFDAIKKIAVV